MKFYADSRALCGHFLGLKRRNLGLLLIFLCSFCGVLPTQATSKLEASVGTIPHDTLVLGGAFRYTYMNNSWSKAHQDKGGQVVFDALILTASGRIKGIDFAVESRYYAEAFGGFMLRNGYVGLPLTSNLYLKLGMPRTPFGLIPYTGNSFMFNMPYYLGFEDDADFGVLLEYEAKNHWKAQLNFAKNSEDVFSQKNNRYAYDISGDNEELNQWTGRLVYAFGTKKNNEIGLSGQFGQIYNTLYRTKGHKSAEAIHVLLNQQRWTFKFQVLYYDFAPDYGPNTQTPFIGSEPQGVTKDYIELGAFAGAYKVASQGLSSCASISYTWPIHHFLLNDLKLYNDFSSLHKTVGSYDDSYMNVLGCMVHTGPIFMLIDYVVAQNHPWIGTHYEDAFYDGTSSQWETRFNLNLGVYF